MKLDNVLVGPGHPAYIIAEVGANHDRDIGKARRLIEVAKEAGCQAVKFQSYTAEGIYSRFTPRISEMEGRSNKGETPYELIKRIEMPVDWHRPLREHCARVGITFCSTPFDESMVDVLESVQTPFYKVASYELTHYPMLGKIARLGKPVILSTGNSDMEDIRLAIETLRDNGCPEWALLHCVSQYPAQYADMNLRCIETLRQTFGCLVGLSDHTMDHLSSIASVALGACIVEKHMTLDRKSFGPDHPFALEPNDLHGLVRAIRTAELALGDGVKDVRASEAENHRIGRRSILAAADIKAGEIITRDHLVIKRPALGIHPKHLAEVVGKRARKDILRDRWFSWDDLEDR